ncbi:MAG: ammonium transporter [Methyloprofundus sp.]|nr:ammonium transporter [Methyloprofundus sp.]
MEQLTELSYALDTFYFLICGAFVMWMAAGFSMLEAGLVRAKNTTEILTKNVALFAIACTMYMLCGYNLMYPAEAVNSIWPGISFLIEGDHSVADVLASKGDTYYSSMADFFFQVVFVATAMSIVSGAVAERMKLWAFLVFSVVMTGFIYPVQGYWKWGAGFLDQLGFLDFAGSGVVHLCGATAALAGVVLLGARKGKYGANGEVYPIPGCNMPLATLGMFILWMGWFGFNGGSQLAIHGIENANAVALIFVNTNAAAAAGVISALLTAHLLFGKADLSMSLNGALAGLVAITAEPLTPTPLLSAIIGAIAGVIVVFSIIGFDKLKIDDPVGALSVHGVVGIWGLLAVCLSNDESTITAQLIGIVTIFAFVFVASFIAWYLIKLVMGIRVTEEEEYQGVDYSECGMEAYPEFTNAGK